MIDYLPTTIKLRKNLPSKNALCITDTSCSEIPGISWNVFNGFIKLDTNIPIYTSVVTKKMYTYGIG